jgi:hypothetical protein
MKQLIISSSIMMVLLIVSSCGKKIEACANFDKSAYLVNDTIVLNATCSENVDTYLWQPQAGLQMLGTGKSATERFVVLSLQCTLSRTIDLTLSNAKATRKISKSVVVL